jgi:hypothetical protein
VLTGKYGCAVAPTWSSGGREVVRSLNHVLNYLGALTIPRLHVALENDEQAVCRGKESARMFGKDLVKAIRSRMHFPDQEAFIEENRAFFSSIVTENREWRPEAYDEWVEQGPIR